MGKKKEQKAKKAANLRFYLANSAMESGPVVSNALMHTVGGNAYEAWLIAYIYRTVSGSIDVVWTPVYHESDNTAWLIDDGSWSEVTGIPIDKISEAVVSLLNKKYLLLREFEVEGTDRKVNGYTLNWNFLVSEIAKHHQEW